MSDNMMVPLNLDQLPSTQLGTDEVLEKLAEGGGFLGRIQLCSKGKLIDKGVVKPGHYAIPQSGDAAIDLGSEIDVLPLARRPKALDTSDNDAIINCYDPSSDTFKDIAERSEQPNSNCQYGTEYLVIERSTGRFLTYFLGSKSHRPEARNISPNLPMTRADIERRGLDCEPHGPIPLTLKSKLVEKKNFSWFVPVDQPCSTPLTGLPDQAEIVRQIQKFLDVASAGDGVEKVQEPEGKKRRAR